MLLDTVALSAPGGGQMLSEAAAAQWLRERSQPGIRVTQFERHHHLPLIATSSAGWRAKPPLTRGQLGLNFHRYAASGAQDAEHGQWKIDTHHGGIEAPRPAAPGSASQRVRAVPAWGSGEAASSCSGARGHGANAAGEAPATGPLARLAAVAGLARGLPAAAGLAAAAAAVGLGAWVGAGGVVMVRAG